MPVPIFNSETVAKEINAQDGRASVLDENGKPVMVRRGKIFGAVDDTFSKARGALSNGFSTNKEPMEGRHNHQPDDPDNSPDDNTKHKKPPIQDGRNGSGVEGNNNMGGGKKQILDQYGNPIDTKKKEPTQPEKEEPAKTEQSRTAKHRALNAAGKAALLGSVATNMLADDGSGEGSLWGSMAEGAMNGGMMGAIAGPKGAAFGAIGGALYGAYQHFAGGGEGGGQQQVAQQNINVANATLQANTNAAGNFAQSGQGSFATPGGTVSIGADAQVMASCNGGVAAVAFCVHTWPRIFGGLWKQLRLSTLFLLYSFGYNTPMFKIYKTESFAKWQAGLKDIKTRAAIVRRLERVEQGNFGDHAAIGGGVSEMRIFLGPGYRLYCTIRGEEIVVLLAGGDKSTQEKDIKKAKAMAKELK